MSMIRLGPLQGKTFSMAAILIAFAIINILSVINGETLTKCQSNGRVFNVGQVYIEKCSFCTCEAQGPVCHEASDMLCNPIFKREARAVTCSRNGVDYQLGETTSDGFHFCHCTEQGMKCLTLPAGKRMTAPYCTKEGVIYQVGETFRDSSSRLCHCTEDALVCLPASLLGTLGKRQTSNLAVEKRLMLHNDCIYKGKTYSIGESYTVGISVANGGLKKCVCQKNVGFLCATVHYKDQRDLAPYCTKEGVIYQVGETFRDSSSRLCHCTEDALVCLPASLLGTLGKRQTSNLAVEKRLMLHNDCIYKGKTYSIGESYTVGISVANGGLKKCVCQKNVGFLCATVHYKDQRDLAQGTCSHGGKDYGEGEKHVRDCEECTCRGGKWSCHMYWMCELGR